MEGSEIFDSVINNLLAGHNLLSYLNMTHIQAQSSPSVLELQLEMWASAQRGGRPAEYRWHPLFNAEVWLTPTTRVPCSNAAKARNPLKFAGVPQTRQRISAVNGPTAEVRYGDVWRRYCCLTIFPDCRYMP